MNKPQQQNFGLSPETLTCRLVTAPSQLFHLKLPQLIKTMSDTPRGEVGADSLVPPTTPQVSRYQTNTGSPYSHRGSFGPPTKMLHMA